MIRKIIVGIVVLCVSMTASAALVSVDPDVLDRDSSISGGPLEEMIQEAKKVAEAALETGRGPLEGLLLFDLGRLQWLLAQISQSGPDGGWDESRDSESTVRQAVAIFVDGGEPAAGFLIDARLTLAEILTGSVCSHDTDENDGCAARHAEAADLARRSLQAAREAHDTRRIAASLRFSASLREDDRDRSGAGRLLQEALQLEGEEWSLGRIETLTQLALLESSEGRRDRALELSTQAVAGCAVLDLLGWHRVAAQAIRAWLYLSDVDNPTVFAFPSAEARAVQKLIPRAFGPDVRRLLLRRAWELFRYAGDGDGPAAAFALASQLIEENRLSEAEDVLADVLADPPREGELWALRSLEAEIDRRQGNLTGARNRLIKLRQEISSPPQPSSDWKHPYWILRITRELTRIDMSGCQTTLLQSDIQELLQAEKTLFEGSMRWMSESRLRATFVDLFKEDEIFEPVARCGLSDRALLRATIERVLLRRELWRYRTEIMKMARAGGSERAQETAEQLIELRRLRAQLRLRVEDEALMNELQRIPLPKNLSHPEDAAPAFVALMELEFAIDSFERVLADELRERRPFGKEAESLWPHLLEGLGDEGVLVGYLPLAAPPATQRVVAFVVDGTGKVQLADIGEQKPLDDLLRWVYLALRTDNAKSALREAGKVLLDPIEPWLAGKKSVRLLASHQMRFMPWSALLDRHGSYLGDALAVTWLQSASDARSAPEVFSGSSGDVVLVAPEYRLDEPAEVRPESRLVPGGFRPLPETLKELSSIEQIFRGQGLDYRSITGSIATERTIRDLKSPRLLHIAAHGFQVAPALTVLGGEGQGSSSPFLYWPIPLQGFLEPSFLRVGMAFAEANRGAKLPANDGLLSASEASDLDLRDTSLVVLSGCETAYPTLQDIGGSYDLSLGFRTAGARTVVGSLWKVDDEATRLLMEEMYKSLAAGDSVAVALWKGKKSLQGIPRFTSPLFWAAFEIFGTGEPVWSVKSAPRR